LIVYLFYHRMHVEPLRDSVYSGAKLVKIFRRNAGILNIAELRELVYSLEACVRPLLNIEIF
jgi:hypothetical protein